MKNKKIASVLLAVIMVIATVSVAFTVFANDSGNYTYQLIDENTCSITGYTGNDTDLVIPSEIDGYTVTKIGVSAFEQPDDDTKKVITSVVIPETVKTIEATAFFGTDITEIIIPEGVEAIGQQAFSFCNNLVTAKISASVSGIGKSAFYGNPNMQSVNIDDNNAYYKSVDGVIFNKDMSKIIYYPAGKTTAFYNIPDTVTLIDEYAFAECKNLNSVTIPNGVTEIGDFAFCWSGLNPEIVLPESIEYLGGWAFAQCPGLTTIVILSKADSIEISEGTFDSFGTFQTFIGYKDCAAENMVKEWNSILTPDELEKVNYEFVAIEQVVTDKNTGITVIGSTNDAINYGSALEVSIKEKSDTSITYNIALVYNGSEIQPSDPVTVKIPVPSNLNGQTCKIFRIEADGVHTDMNAEFKDGFMIFSTEHFSEYILTGDKISNVDTPISGGTENNDQEPQTEADKNDTPANQSKDDISKVQNASIPNTGAEVQNSISVYFVIAVCAAVLFLCAALLRTKKLMSK